MLIRCPTCLETYDLPPDVLKGGGTMLRCARCRDIWAAAEIKGLQPALRRRPEGHLGPEIVAEARSERRAPAGPAFGRVGRTRARAGPRRVASPAVAVLSALAVLVSGMAAVARKDLVVRLCPPSAALFEAVGLPVNLRGLALADMHGTLSNAGSGPVLTVQGRVSNLRREPTAVPALRIAVRDKAHNELYSWTAPAPKSRLGAGETIVFRSRLVAPPEDGQDLMVSFAETAGAPARVRSENR